MRTKSSLPTGAVVVLKPFERAQLIGKVKDLLDRG
jgi:hypothetical protein